MGPTLSGSQKQTIDDSVEMPRPGGITCHSKSVEMPPAVNRGPPTLSSQARLNYSDPHKPAKTLLGYLPIDWKATCLLLLRKEKR
jgi:hypothetical protein